MPKPHSNLHLTDSIVAGLPYAAESSRRGEHWDSLLPGLVLRIGKRSKTFYLIVGASGRPIKQKLGRFPGVGVERARILAEARLRDRVRTSTRSATRSVVTVKDFPNVELLTTREAALLTKMSMAWYERKRWEGLGPPYYRRGRVVRYVRQELLDWWLASRVSHRDSD